ncbi:predicted protein [Postia placenta Mad-698-R]|nr:predicted protein [Postia placenta Mad-698-R]
MSSTLSFLDQFNAPSTEGGKRLSIYTPKHTHVGDSTLLTLLLSNPTDVFNKLKAHNPEATNATDRAALEAYLSTRREYDEAVKAADEAIDHHKRLLRQQDDRVLTELIWLDNLKVAHRFQPLLPRSIRARHNKFIPRAIPNAYLPLPTPLPTSAFRRPPIPSPFLQATPRSTTIPADWQPNPGWTPKGSCRRCGSSRHWVRDCPDVRCAGCGKEAPGHLERECGTRPMKRHISAPPEEPARRVGVVVDNVFLEGIINEAKERKQKERQMKAVPIPPPRSANPEPPASPVAGPSRPRPDTPVVFRKVDPDWTPDTTQWTWDSSWPNQKHLSGEEWMNVGRNARKEWFDEEEDDGVDWELYGDGEHWSVRSMLTQPWGPLNISSTITSNNAVNPVSLGLPALAGSPLLQYDQADHCFVTSTKKAPIYPRDGTWCCATGPNPQVIAHQELVSYYQRHPPAYPEDIFTILRINVEPTQTAESVQSPINEQPLELPEVQYVPIKILNIELPPAPPTPTNAPVEVPMATFTQEDIDQHITIALTAYQSQQSTANLPLCLDIPAPKPFSGKAKDLRHFIQCILSYFVITNNTRLSDEAKIAFTVAVMRKDLGKTWADTYYKKLAGGVQVYSTWADFVATLEEKNRKMALSLGNYITHFEQLASKAQLKDTEVNGTNRVENDYHTLHAKFVKGLPKELYFVLATRAWYNEVRNADAAKQETLIVTDTRDYGEPMDIDAAAVTTTFTSTLEGRK